MDSKPSSSRGIYILLPILFGLLAILFSTIIKTPGPEVEISRREIVKSNFDFIYEHWQEEKLARLLEQENYRDIKAQDQPALFLALCDWVHNQWQRSVPDPYPLSNAIDILADIRSGKTGGFCGQYAYVLTDVLKSMGFFAVRYVELWSKDKESHFVVEVWSDRFEKWLVLDADHNLYYEVVETGIPANAYEIRSSLLGGKRVRAIAADSSRADWGDKKAHLYANFAVSLRSDLMRHTKPLTVQDRFRMFLFYQDEHSGSRYFEQGIPYFHVSGRMEDLYYPCNCARAEYRVDEESGNVTIKVFTDGSMPNFKCFALSRDRGKSWQQFKGNAFTLQKKEKKEHLLWVAPVNMYDRLGCITTIRIRF